MFMQHGWRSDILMLTGKWYDASFQFLFTLFWGLLLDCLDLYFMGHLVILSETQFGQIVAFFPAVNLLPSTLVSSSLGSSVVSCPVTDCGLDDEICLQWFFLLDCGPVFPGLWSPSNDAIDLVFTSSRTFRTITHYCVWPALTGKKRNRTRVQTNWLWWKAVISSLKVSRITGL